MITSGTTQMARTNVTMPNHDGGKGAVPRPIPDRETFNKNWDAIFKPKPPKGGFLTTKENEQTTITPSTTNN